MHGKPSNLDAASVMGGLFMLAITVSSHVALRVEGKPCTSRRMIVDNRSNGAAASVNFNEFASLQKAQHEAKYA